MGGILVEALPLENLRCVYERRLLVFVAAKLGCAQERSGGPTAGPPAAR